MAGKNKTGLGGVGVFWLPKRRRGHHGGHERRVQPPGQRRHLLQHQPPYKPSLNFHDGEHLHDGEEKSLAPGKELNIPMTEIDKLKPRTTENPDVPNNHGDEVSLDNDTTPSCSKTEETVDYAIGARKPNLNRASTQMTQENKNSCCTECIYFCIDSCNIL